MSIQSFITNLPLFQFLPPDIIHKLALSVEPLVFSPFEYILRKGDTCGDIYFIIEGSRSVEPRRCDRDPIGEVIKWKLFWRNVILNYLQNKPRIRTATIRSVTYCELMVIKSEYLEKLCDDYPTIIEDMKITAEERKVVKPAQGIFRPNWSINPTRTIPPQRDNEKMKMKM